MKEYYILKNIYCPIIFCKFNFEQIVIPRKITVKRHLLHFLFLDLKKKVLFK